MSQTVSAPDVIVSGEHEVSDSTVCVICVRDLIKQAFDQAPNTRKNRRLKNRYERGGKFAERFEEKTIETLNEDETFKTMLPQVAAAMSDPEAFSATTLFSVVKMDLQRLFDLILEYGPQLAEMVIAIIKLFQGLSFVVAFAIALELIISGSLV